MTDEVKRDRFGASEYWVSEDDGSICLSDMDGSGGSIDECEVAKRLNEGVRLSAAHAREIEAKDARIDELAADRDHEMFEKNDALEAMDRQMTRAKEAEAALAASREEAAGLQEAATRLEAVKNFSKRVVDWNTTPTELSVYLKNILTFPIDGAPLRAKVDDNVLTGEQTPRHQPWCKPQRDGGCECGAEK